MKFYRNYDDGGANIAPKIRRAPRERDWMNGTSDQFAYRCLPLAIANQHGWEIYFESAIRFIWHGGSDESSVEVLSSGHDFVQSMFGYGIISFHIGHLIRTSPGYDLYISGSPNHFKRGIHPLTGVVETSWSPYTFTMNWKITEVDTVIEFSPREPFCFFFPVDRGLLERVEVEVLPVSHDPSLDQEFQLFSKMRAEHIEATRSGRAKDSWQKDYFQGKLPSGAYPSTADRHHTKLRLANPDYSNLERTEASQASASFSEKGDLK